MANKPYLDPITIAQLGNLSLRARRILDGLYSGRHINPLRGNSQEFSQHKPYNIGDDLRTLDWKVYGRTERLVVKEYQEETNIAGTVILDDSASMKFSWDQRLSKLEYAKTLAAALGYLMVSQNDAIGLLTNQSRILPGSNRGHLERFFQGLTSVEPSGIWDFPQLIQKARSPLRKKSFVFIFSDLLGDEDRLIQAIRSLQAQKHEVIVFQIFDPVEYDLSFSGPILFEDLETGEKLKTEPEAIREDYQKRVKKKIAGFSQVFRSSGIEYLFLTTNTPFDKGLAPYLSWRGTNK